jgi:hypothetical protein
MHPKIRRVHSKSAVKNPIDAEPAGKASMTDGETAAAVADFLQTSSNYANSTTNPSVLMISPARHSRPLKQIA